MAGSYGHLVLDDGIPYRNDAGHLDTQLIENMGDATEAIEELFGMIWYLADGNRNLVEEAREHYRLGLQAIGLIPYGTH